MGPAGGWGGQGDAGGADLLGGGGDEGNGHGGEGGEGAGRSKSGPWRDVVGGKGAPAGDLADEARKDHAVDGVEKVPVGEARQTAGGEEGLLDDAGSAVLGLELKEEPGFAGQFHLRPQSQEAVPLFVFGPRRHGVHEVARVAYALQGGPEALRVQEIPLDRFGPFPPAALQPGGSRARQRTAYPRARRRGTSRPPTYPVAPVTRTFGFVPSMASTLSEGTSGGEKRASLAESSPPRCHRSAEEAKAP